MGLMGQTPTREPSAMSNTSPPLPEPRDHGGGLDAAMARFGGCRTDWIDLSTGINPVPYPLPGFTADDWTRLPDLDATAALEGAARRFWDVPARCRVLAAPGASALIARIPALAPAATVRILTPTYNEHAAAFRAQGWTVTGGPGAEARVLVHPNNPDGRVFSASDMDAPLVVIDESFCDTMPDRSLMAHADRPGCIVLKSFGKFWGLAGLRLGFAIGDPALVDRLSDMLGPWPVAGPALRAGTVALGDAAWADATRARLVQDAARLDALVTARGAQIVGGTPLFRLYRVGSAAEWQDRLAHQHIWTRIFPYSDTLIRLGLPGPADWDRIEAAL
jgi:cobalamin biosynthetic protein CobC